MNSEELYQTNKNSSILFLDVSSSCTGYTVADCSWETRSANLSETGVLWFNPKWTHAEKYHYIGKAIMEYFYVTGKCDYLVHEAYAINPKQMGGVLVCPEMLGAIKFASAELGIKVDSISPQSWRKACGIKPITENGKRDYKEPTKQFFKKKVDIPETVLSNITGQERNTPSDLYDSLGVAYGWLSTFKQLSDELFFRKITFNTKINPHIGYNFDL